MKYSFTPFLILLLLFFTNKLNAQQNNLFINEIQVANTDQFIDPSYNYGGWIELYNSGTNIVNLYGYKVRHTDSDGKIEQVVLKSTHGSVPVKGYKVLWFDHNSSDGYYSNDAAKQIPFKLDADGGIIEFLDDNNSVIDAIEYPASISRCSWMREKDGANDFAWTSEPSPNASNDTCIVSNERLQSPEISTTGGVFTDSYHFTVKIPEGCILYYTTDGSAPYPANSQKSEDGIFCGNENVIYRFMLTCRGYLNSPVITRSFFRSDNKYSLPILSVNTAPDNFFDSKIGLYVTGENGRVANNSKIKANQNMDWERPVNVEYFVPDEQMNYREAFNQEASFSIFGGWTRFNDGNEDFEHRSSFKLKSDKVFEGKNTFAYPIFNSKPHIKIKNFLVRNGGQDQNARVWDAAIHELLRTSGVYLDCQAWQPAHVYLNGKYLGMMNLREESNWQFAYSNYGIDKDEIDQWEDDIFIKVGDLAKLNEWNNLSKRLTGSASDSTVWKMICNLVDIDEYCNYMAAEIYMGNLDWLRKNLKNLKGFRAKDDNAKFHLVLHDADGGFGDTDMMLQLMSKGSGSLSTRFKNMLKYEPFKKQFIDAYCIMDGSVFDPERCAPIITSMRNTINPALQLEGLSANEKTDLLIERLSDVDKRKKELKSSIKSAFALKNEYTITIHSNIYGAKLLVDNQEIPTGKFNGYLFPPFSLTSLAPDGYKFKGWRVNGTLSSSDQTILFSTSFTPNTYEIEAVYEQTNTVSAPVRINEVSAGNDIYINEYGKKTDWVELYNPTDENVDLDGMYLSDNPQNLHKYQIAASEEINTIIPAHGHKIIWCDGKESGVQLHAPFKLKNEDDSFISITDANNAWTDSLRYKEQPRWYTYGRIPDGGSHLAMFERPTIDNSNRICTSSVIESNLNISNNIKKSDNNQIVSIKYYNLNGQQIADIRKENIVIQKILYSDGQSKTVKVIRTRP